MNDLREYLDRLSKLCASFDVEALCRARDQIVQCLSSGRRVFLAGNGGSAMTADHWANDLRCASGQAGWSPINVQSLSSNTAQLTALANDHGYEHVFARALRECAQPGDLLIVLSASGTSPNIVHALSEAGTRDMRTVGFLGMGGGEAKALCEVAVVIDADDYGPIEDLHLVCNHAIARHIRSLGGVGTS